MDSGSSQDRPSRQRPADQDDLEEVDTSAVGERVGKLTDDVDALLDDIDATLEENAEEFVKAFVQKGGQ